MGLITELVEAWSSLISYRTARKMRQPATQDAILRAAVARHEERLQRAADGASGDEEHDDRGERA